MGAEGLDLAWCFAVHRVPPLGKEMETHPSILAWEIAWIEEPGVLQSMGSQRVGHDWAHKHTHTQVPPRMLIR